MDIYEELENKLNSLVGEKFTKNDMLYLQELLLQLRANIRESVEDELNTDLMGRISKLDCRDKFPIPSEEWENGYNAALYDLELV